MKVQRDNLLEVLKQCLPGIETGNSVIEGADTFLFRDNWVSTYNGNISISTPFPFESVSGTVRASEFFQIVSKLPAGELAVAQREKMWLIRTGKIRVEITLMEQELDGYIKGLALDNVKWLKLPGTFKDGLKGCIMNDQSGSYAGIFVKEPTMCSTDGRLINRFDLGKRMEGFWIRDNSASELLKLDGLDRYGISDGWVHFRDGEQTFFSCMRLNEENFSFDKLNTVLEKHERQGSDLSNELPDGVGAALDRASALSMEVSGFKAVQMILGKDAVEVYSRRSAGSYSEKVPWEKPFDEEFEPVSVLIDCDSARYALMRSKRFYVRQGEKNTIRLVFFDDSFVHLIATLKQPEE